MRSGSIAAGLGSLRKPLVECAAALAFALLAQSPAHADRLSNLLALNLDSCLDDSAEVEDFKAAGGAAHGVVIRCFGEHAKKLRDIIQKQLLGKPFFETGMSALKFGHPVSEYAQCITRDSALHICAFFLPGLNRAEAERLLVQNALYQVDVSELLALNDKVRKALAADDDDED